MMWPTDSVSDVTSPERAARKIASVATRHGLVVVGPILASRDGDSSDGYGRWIAFTNENGCATALIGVGDSESGPVQRALFAAELRIAFATVVLASTHREWVEAMAAAWQDSPANAEWQATIDAIEAQFLPIGI